jgi:colanic acid/amylovoran biosynthesis glycosyltransferase
MKIAYLMQKYPSLTLTFVYREVSALRAAGLAVDTFSIWKPRPGDLSQEAWPRLAETWYVFPWQATQMLSSHLRYLLRQPRRYLGTLLFCLRHDGEGWRRWARGLGHFLEGGALAAEMERRGIQHVHAHFARGATTAALVIERLTGIPFSFTVHANDIFVRPTMLREKLAAAQFAIGISEYNRQLLLRLAPEAHSKVHVVHCGVDIARFAPAAHFTPPAAHGDVVPLILSVGRLVEKKGFRHLVAACQILAERGCAFQCEIVGEGPERAALEAQITASGLAGQVRLAGAVFQEQLGRHLAAAQIFTMPCVAARDGDMDGIPSTLMEAMSMELPVVSTRLSGIPELVEDGRSGLLVAPGDDEALAAALARLLGDGALRARLGQAGRAKVAAEFEIGATTQNLLRIFRAELPAESAEPANTAAYAEVSG